MANTLNLGTDGNWAVKKDSLLAYNDENGNFKPLPFDFTRDSSATVVNKAGLIETVGSGEPRIDFKDDAKGALLLEPQRSNYWTNSEGSSIVLSSPLGEFGFHIINNTFLNRAITYVGTITFTFIVKKIDGTIPTITASSGSGDLVVLVSGSSSVGVSGVLTDIGNGFYKYELTTDADGGSVARIQNNSGLDTYVSLIQYEQGSYATSYIPTSGSAVTRVADLSDTQNLSHVIGQTEGVIFYDAILVHKSTSTAEDLFELSIDDGSNQNMFFINNYNNALIVGLNNGGSNQFYNNSYNPTEGARYKLAFAYKQNDFALYINGNQIATDSSGTVPTMNQITFGNYYNNSPSASSSVEVNDFRFYNTRLTDNELQKLTAI